MLFMEKSTPLKKPSTPQRLQSRRRASRHAAAFQPQSNEPRGSRSPSGMPFPSVTPVALLTIAPPSTAANTSASPTRSIAGSALFDCHSHSAASDEECRATTPPPPAKRQCHPERQRHRSNRSQASSSRGGGGPISLATFLLVATVFCCAALNAVVEAGPTNLEGVLQSCHNEGEEVNVTIKNSQCYKCMCLNGFVNCLKDTCPPLEDCYLLDSQETDTCCKKCKGCVFRGLAYPSGAEWTDPEDPCRTYKCIASVITETTMMCYNQCDDGQLAEPRPGECCPTCQGCQINGQTVLEGQEVEASIDDRCLVCQCWDNQLTCAKKTCPILQCPPSKQIKHPDDCCPRCTERRVYMQVAGRCLFNSNLYYDKTEFTPDRCTNCLCSNGTSICQRQTCPILECSPEYQEMDGCCPRCIVSEVRAECSVNGQTYANNETWNLGPCRSCRCTHGNVRCSEMRCPPLECRPNEVKQTAPGECCAKCVETAGTCSVFGDPHFKTFDGKFFSFQGSCKYLLAADCRDHAFSIRLTNDGRNTTRSSWTKTVTLKMKGVRVNLGQKMRVKVNGTRVSMPYEHGSLLSIHRLPEGIMLRTELGIAVEWDGNNFLQVTVPATFKRKLCGLCGNYNGLSRDDLTARDGSNHSDREVWRFANSWKVGGPKACSRKKENIAVPPTCKQRKSTAYCRPLRESSVFGHCDNRLNPQHYWDACRMDVCECPTGMCHCDSFAAYAHDCARLGVRLPDWRAATNCPVGLWRRNATVLVQELLRNPLYGDLRSFVGKPWVPPPRNAGTVGGYQRPRGGAGGGGGGGGEKSLRRRKQQHQHHSSGHSHNELLQSDFITKHVPQNLLVSKPPDRTPPPIH